MNELSPRRHDKFRAYRARKRAAGLREVRLWAPDVDAPGFWERSLRAAEVLHKSPEEDETVRFIERLNQGDPGLWD